MNPSSSVQFIIVAKSREGWGVAIGSDVVQQFASVVDALAHAEELRSASAAEGLDAEVVDLSDADLPGALMPR